jgi:hypothetical protein
MPSASGIAITSSEAWDGGFNIYALKRGATTVAQRYTQGPGDTLWTRWFCFDAFPKPDRLASGELINGLAELVATTGCHTLYRRTQRSDGWPGWEPFDMPSASSAVTDSAMSVNKDGINHVYVADSGRVFVRHRVGSDSYSPYGPWREISGASAVTLLTAGLRSDLRQQVFTLDPSGLLRTAIQLTADLDSEFGPWSDFDSNQLPARLIDIEAPQGGPFPLEVFGVDSKGALWQRAGDAITGEFQAWTAWDGPPPLATLISLSGAALQRADGAPLQLVGLGATGGVYTVRRKARAWLDWHYLP